MAHKAQITDEMQRAVEILRADPDVQITEELHPTPDGELALRCTVPVLPQPNPEKLPARAKLRVRLDPAFPYHEVDVYTEDPEVRAFPHQDAESHKLCLLQKRDAPLNPYRLKTYIDWSKQWLSDAATGNLLPKGHPYELPDFSCKAFKKKMTTDLPVLFDESPASFSLWLEQVYEYGRVELVPGKTTKGLLVRSFRASNGNLIREWNYPENVVDGSKRLFGFWVLLPTLTRFRNRPPQTFGELAKMCREGKVDLLQIVKKAWEEKNLEPETAFLLVGCPIPKIAGQDPQEVHWQPIFFQSQRTIHRELKRDDKHANFTKSKAFNLVENKGAFSETAALPWGKSENIANGRLYARGGLDSFCKQRVVLAGCGAVGSIAAEMLARGGGTKLTLIDGDLIEMGNLCRHTLDGRDLRAGKADALASRLQSSNPFAKIDGFVGKLPLGTGDRKALAQLSKILEEANIIIDCTTDEDAFQWLNRVARRNRARMVSLFLNFDASILTLAISGRTTSCHRVCQMLYADVAEGRTPISQEKYRGIPKSEDLVIPGAGCWSPTFPGSNANIWSLTAVAIDALNTILQKPLKTDGLGILFARNNGELVQGAAQIQTAWLKKYR